MFSNNYFRFDFYYHLIGKEVDSLLREESKMMPGIVLALSCHRGVDLQSGEDC